LRSSFSPLEGTKACLPHAQLRQEEGVVAKADRPANPVARVPSRKRCSEDHAE